MRTSMYIAGIIGLLSLSEVCASDLSLCGGRDSVAIRTQNQNVTAQEKEIPMYDLPIINQDFAKFFASKQRVQVEVSVEEATGRSEKVRDFFMIEPKGDFANVPITLATILPKSEFLKQAIICLFKSGYDVLKISETLSEPSSQSTVNGFIGIKEQDLPFGLLK